MNITDEELDSVYLEWIEHYCNNSFPSNNLPGGVKLALKQLKEVDPMQFNVTSQKISDMSQTFSDTGGDVPVFITRYLEPYKRLRTL